MAEYHQASKKNRGRERNRSQERRKSPERRPSKQNHVHKKESHRHKRERSRSNERHRNRSRSPPRTRIEIHRQDNGNGFTTTRRDTKEDFKISPLELEEELPMYDNNDEPNINDDEDDQVEEAAIEIYEEIKEIPKGGNEIKEVIVEKVAPRPDITDIKSAYSKENRISMLGNQETPLRVERKLIQVISAKPNGNARGKEINKNDVIAKAQQQREEQQKKARRHDVNKFLASMAQPNEEQPQQGGRSAQERIVLSRLTKLKSAPKEDLREKFLGRSQPEEDSAKSILSRISKKR